jgi:LMBR1 domain-containing protein 1
LSFVLGCLSLLGVLFWAFYTGYALGYLPWKLIKGTKSLDMTQTELEMDVAKIRESYRELQLRATRTNTQPTRREKKELATLKRKEHALSLKSERLSEIKKDSSVVLSKALSILSPFRVVIGVCCLALSWVIAAGILLVSLDKFYNSECGFKCGYILTVNTFYNPVDSVLVELSKAFPFDFAAFVVLISYFYIASLYGVIRLGIRFLCLAIFEVRRKRTMPQGLLISAVIMMFMFLGMSLEILTIAPQYSTFGSQSISDGSACSLDTIDQCSMTNTAKIFNKISIGVPLFSGLTYWLNWVFVGVFGVGNLLGMFKSPGNAFEENYDEDDEEESLLVS